MTATRAPVIRECDRCHAAIVPGQWYTLTAPGYRHRRLVGCAVGWLVRLSARVGA